MSRVRATAVRYDSTLRVVIWTDAFLSAALALVAVVSPVVAVVPVAPPVAAVIGLVALGLALLLAGLGAVTAVLLAIRTCGGDDHVPPALRVPLPAAMRPDFGTGSRSSTPH